MPAKQNLSLNRFQQGPPMWQVREVCQRLQYTFHHFKGFSCYFGGFLRIGATCFYAKYPKLVVFCEGFYT